MLKTRAGLLAEGVTRGVLAGPRFERVVYGIHAPAGVEQTLGLRCEALQLAVPDGVFSHQTAARILGLPVRGTRGPIDMTVAPPKNPPRRNGVKGYERELASTDIVEWRGLRVTSAARTFADVAAQLPARELVVVGDVILRRHLATLAELTATAERLAGRRGLAGVRWALPRLDAKSGSPQESRLRLRFEDEGLPRPVCNLEIYDDAGGYIACPDLVLEEAKIGVEFDGEHHLEREKQHSDSIRDRLMTANGWAALRATSRDIDPRRHDLFDTIRQLLSRRTSWRPS